MPMLVLVLVAIRFGPGWTVCTGPAFRSYALWWAPHGPDRPELTLNTGEMALSALYVLMTVAVLVGLEPQAVANE
ncbi:hypothetical protein ACWGI8_39060 [Streptomyces sp. NPDC054841]